MGYQSFQFRALRLINLIHQRFKIVNQHPIFTKVLPKIENLDRQLLSLMQQKPPIDNFSGTLLSSINHKKKHFHHIFRRLKVLEEIANLLSKNIIRSHSRYSSLQPLWWSKPIATISSCRKKILTPNESRTRHLNNFRYLNFCRKSL